MLGSLFRRSNVDERAIQATPWGEWAGDSSLSQTYAGTRVDSTSALQLITVYGCVRLIADSIATLPIDVYRQTSDTKFELATPDWLEYPTIGCHRVAWLTQVLSSLLLDGNSYCAVSRNAAGAIVELVPLDAKQVSVTREEGRRVYRVNGAVPRYDILHIPGLMLAGAETGLSPVEMARQSIGLGMATQEFGAKFFSQGANLSGVIEDPGELDPQKATETAKIWARLHSGLNKAHLPGVLQGGAVWKSTGVTNEQAQFLETRGFTAAEIAGQMFLVDPSDLGIPVSGTSLTYANLEQRNVRRVQVTLLPWIVRLEHALSDLLARPRYVKFNVNGLLRGDTSARTAYYDKALAGRPWMEPNEVRDLEDMDPSAAFEHEEPPAVAPVPSMNGNGVPANA